MPSDQVLDSIVILFFTLIPILLLLTQAFLSTRKKLVWGFVIPFMWAVLGLWILNSRFSSEMLLFFIGGEAILLGLLTLIRYLKRRKSGK